MGFDLDSVLVFEYLVYIEGEADMKPKKIQAFLVNRESPAWEAIGRICKDKIKSGSVHAVSEKELESFKEDFIMLEIDRYED